MPPRLGAQRPYRFSFTAASLRPELLAVVAEVFLKSGSWDFTKAEILRTNALQCRSAASLNRLEREIRPRLQTLTRPQIELVYHATVESRTHLGWLSAVKHSAFLLGFSAEALRSKLGDHETILLLSDYRRFIEEKSSQHPELASLTESSAGKVQNFPNLQEASDLQTFPKSPETLQHPRVSSPRHPGHRQHSAQSIPSDYLHKLENRLAHLTHVEATSEIAKQKTAARKESDKLRKTLKECQDWARDVLLPLAQQSLEIDLDDGVKVNYLKFGTALATIAGLAAKEE